MEKPHTCQLINAPAALNSSTSRLEAPPCSCSHTHSREPGGSNESHFNTGLRRQFILRTGKHESDCEASKTAPKATPTMLIWATHYSNTAVHPNQNKHALNQMYEQTGGWN
jgi:hypothetical protein